MGTAFPLDGRHRVVEVYPAAIERTAAGWLRWKPGAREACAHTDHALDAFICAVVARAIMLGLVHSVPVGNVEAARAEGWIAVPAYDALRTLADTLRRRARSREGSTGAE